MLGPLHGRWFGVELPCQALISAEETITVVNLWVVGVQGEWVGRRAKKGLQSPPSHW